MTSPKTPPPVQPVEYKGEPLDAERGPGLGCFKLQLVVLVVLLVLTPLTVAWNWSPTISIVLLVVVLLLLLLTGQTMIFLLRLVAAGRSEGRRRPLASATPTVGELEDHEPAGTTPAPATPAEGPDAAPGVAPEETTDGPRWPGSGVRE